MSEASQSIYSAAGGNETFRRLVDRFYDGVAGDEVLRPLYPEDLAASREHLFLFLIQYFGGPAHYSALRGHPRLRMRHLPFAIGVRERDAWMHHMRAAIAETGLAEPVRAVLLRYFEDVATFLINRAEGS
jgi:hemoglobin